MSEKDSTFATIVAVLGGILFALCMLLYVQLLQNEDEFKKRCERDHGRIVDLGFGRMLCVEPGVVME